MAGEGAIGAAAGAEAAGVGGLGAPAAAGMAASIGLLGDLSGALGRVSTSMIGMAGSAQYLSGKIDDYMVHRFIRLGKLNKEAAAEFTTEALKLRELSSGYIAAAGAVAGFSMKVVAAFDAQDKINTSMAKFSTLRTMPGGIAEGAKDFMSRQYSLAVSFGDKFVEENKRTYDELLDYTKGMSKEEYEPFLETVTGFSLTTGANYSRAIKTLVNDYRGYGIEARSALRITEGLRIAWDDAKLPLGSFGEGLENILDLAREFTRMGGRPQAAIAQAFGQILTLGGPNGMGMGQIKEFMQSGQQFRDVMNPAAQAPLFEYARMQGRLKPGEDYFGYRERVLNTPGGVSGELLATVRGLNIPKGTTFQQWALKRENIGKAVQLKQLLGITAQVGQSLHQLPGTVNFETQEYAVTALMKIMELPEDDPRRTELAKELERLLKADPSSSEDIVNFVSNIAHKPIVGTSAEFGNALYYGFGALGTGAMGYVAYRQIRYNRALPALWELIKKATVWGKEAEAVASGATKATKMSKTAINALRASGDLKAASKLPLPPWLKRLLGLGVIVAGTVVAGSTAQAEELEGKDSGITAGEIFNTIKDVATVGFETSPYHPGSAEKVDLEAMKEDNKKWREAIATMPGQGFKPATELNSIMGFLTTKRKRRRSSGTEGSWDNSGAGEAGTVIIDVRLNGQAVEQVMADAATQQYVRVNIGNAIGVK